MQPWRPQARRARPDIFAPLDAVGTSLRGRGLGGGVRRFGLQAGRGLFGGHNERLVTCRRVLVTFFEPCLKPFVGFGVCELQLALFVGPRHGDADVHRAEDLALRGGVDAVRQLGEAFVQRFPECEAVRDRERGSTEPRLATCSYRTLPSTRRAPRTDGDRCYPICYRTPWYEPGKKRMKNARRQNNSNKTRALVTCGDTTKRSH